MAPLYDANGREIYEDGVTHDAIHDAIQAATRADDWKLACEIATRYGWNGICLYCAEAPHTDSYKSYPEQLGGWGVCKPCKEILDPIPDFSDVKIYMNGLIKRDVA